MTREVAIDLLSMIEFEHAECCLNTWYKGIDDDMKEAIEMAIRALEQEPCEDAISRQGEKNISKGFEDFMIKSLQRQAESEDKE